MNLVLDSFVEELLGHRDDSSGEVRIVSLSFVNLRCTYFESIDKAVLGTDDKLSNRKIETWKLK